MLSDGEINIYVCVCVYIYIYEMAEKAMAPHSSTLARRSLIGCSPWGC